MLLVLSANTEIHALSRAARDYRPCCTARDTGGPECQRPLRSSLDHVRRDAGQLRANHHASESPCRGKPRIIQQRSPASGLAHHQPDGVASNSAKGHAHADLARAARHAARRHHAVRALTTASSVARTPKRGRQRRDEPLDHGATDRSACSSVRRFSRPGMLAVEVAHRSPRRALKLRVGSAGRPHVRPSARASAPRAAGRTHACAESRRGRRCKFRIANDVATISSGVGVPGLPTEADDGRPTGSRSPKCLLGKALVDDDVAVAVGAAVVDAGRARRRSAFRRARVELAAAAASGTPMVLK